MGRLALVVWVAGLLGGCSQFNMLPPCDRLVTDIGALLIPVSMIPEGGTIDRERLAALIEVSGTRELEAGYNRRTCEATLRLRDGSATATVRMLSRQSDGAQQWQDVEFLNHDEPQFANLVQRLQSQYAGD